MDNAILKKANELVGSGDSEAALQLLSKVGDDERKVGYFVVLGHAYWKCNNHSNAIEAFQHAVVAAPAFEAASLALFHCLLESGRDETAFEEMKRFMRSNTSVEYSRLLNEINRAD